MSAATPDICAQTQPALPGEAGIDQIEMKLVSGAELYEIRDVASKFADNAARLAALFQVLEQAIYTGARISELLALRWQKVHLDRGVIEIRGSMSTAKVKGEASQEKVRWFDPKTKKGERDTYPAAARGGTQGMERKMSTKQVGLGILKRGW